jgi:hypothetical protein
LSYVDTITASQVCSEETLIQYTRQRFGVPTTLKDINLFKSRIRDFLKINQQIDYASMAVGVDWAKSKHLRPRSLLAVMGFIQQAYAAGMLPELDVAAAGQANTEDGILNALQVESDPLWRTRLIASQGSARASVLQEWHDIRGRVVA